MYLFFAFVVRCGLFRFSCERLVVLVSLFVISFCSFFKAIIIRIGLGTGAIGLLHFSALIRYDLLIQKRNHNTNTKRMNRQTLKLIGLDNKNAKC